MLNLLKYEIETIRCIDKFETGIINLGFEGSLESTPPTRYEILDIVLTALGVPEDNELPFPGRDPYNDLYYQAWINPVFDNDPEKVVSKLLDAFIKERDKPKKKKKSKT